MAEGRGSTEEEQEGKEEGEEKGGKRVEEDGGKQSDKPQYSSQNLGIVGKLEEIK